MVVIQKLYKNNYLTFGRFHSISLSTLLKNSDLLFGGNSGSLKSSPFFKQSFFKDENFWFLNAEDPNIFDFPKNKGKKLIQHVN